MASDCYFCISKAKPRAQSLQRFRRARHKFTRAQKDLAARTGIREREEERVRKITSNTNSYEKKCILIKYKTLVHWLTPIALKAEMCTVKERLVVLRAVNIDHGSRCNEERCHSDHPATHISRQKQTTIKEVATGDDHMISYTLLHCCRHTTPAPRGQTSFLLAALFSNCLYLHSPLSSPLSCNLFISLPLPLYPRKFLVF